MNVAYKRRKLTFFAIRFTLRESLHVSVPADMVRKCDAEAGGLRGLKSLKPLECTKNDTKLYPEFPSFSLRNIVPHLSLKYFSEQGLEYSLSFPSLPSQPLIFATAAVYNTLSSYSSGSCTQGNNNSSCSRFLAYQCFPSHV